MFGFCVLLASCGGGSINDVASQKSGSSTGGESTPTTIAIAQSSYSIAESGGTLTVSVTRTGDASGTASVSYATTDGTAIAGNDYTAASGTLTWGEGDTTPQIINIAISNAVPFVGNRSFSIQLSGVSGDATLGATTAATATIIGGGTVSSGNAGTLSLTASVYTVSQGAGTLVVTAIRTGGSTGTVSVGYATADGTAVAGMDYTAVSGTLIWQDGDTSAQTITIPISAASPFTGSRSFSIALSGNTGGSTLGTPSSATATINGSAAPGTVALAASAYSVAQSAGSLIVTVARTGGSTGAISVSYETANGTAVAGSDYTATNGTLSWANGDSSAKTITIPVSTAVPFSGSRSFTLALAGAAGVVGTPSSATVTITGSGAVGTLALGASAYPVAQSAGTLAVTAVRTGGSAGAVSVSYATVNGTAVAGTDYTATNGTLSWADGDTASKTFTIAVSKATPFTGTRTFTIALSGNTGGSTLGSPNSATATITGSGAVNSTLALSSATFNVVQTAASVTLTATRTGGSTGAVSVSYATANGTALAGTDFKAAQGTLSWAAGDSSAKTLQVTLDDPAAYSGTRSFTVALSAPAGGATLGAPSSATVTITGSAAPTACAQSSGSWTDSSQGGNIFDYKQYGNYIVYVDNWGNLPGQTTWANSGACWGVTASPSNTDIGSPRSYPHVTRGWAESGSVLNLSTPGTYDWTTKSGMGIAVSALTKAKMHWTYQAPTATGSRWDALADIYFHTSAAPAPSEWPPAVDLQIIQSLVDEVVGNTTYYALVATNDHASTVTLGGNTYVIFIDDPGGASFHQAGGHTIAVFNLPTSFTSDNANVVWGVNNAVTDIAAIIQYLMQSNPVDDAGKPLKTASGAVVTSPLIPSNLYLTAINGGWEIDVGAVFTNTDFCVAMQGEPDCP